MTEYTSALSTTRDARLKLAETVIQSIQRLQPERGETHLALAQHYYYAYRDYDRARQELVLAHLTLPNESRIPLLAGYIDRRQGRWEKVARGNDAGVGAEPARFFCAPANRSYIRGVGPLQRDGCHP